MNSRSRRAPLLLIAGLALAGCGGAGSDEADGTASVGDVAVAPGGVQGVRQASSSGGEEGGEAGGLPPGLEAKWYQDSDGNAIPDFLETELGYNPAVDDCAPKQCTAPSDGTEMRDRRNTLLVLDASGSMKATVSGQTKIEAAKGSLSRYVRTVTGKTKLGFLVYGHRGNNTPAGKPESCVGIDLLAPIGSLDGSSVDGILARFQPTGWTPIAAALTKSAEAFAGKEGQINRILLVSDGLETCGGDPVGVARSLHQSGMAVQINVVGFDVGAQDAAQLRRVAEVTGGRYAEVRSGAELQAYLEDQTATVVNNREAMLCEGRNSFGGMVCDSKMVLAATARISQESQRASPEQSAAFDALKTRIQELKDQREQAREAASARADTAYSKYKESNQQIGRTLNNRGP